MCKPKLVGVDWPHSDRLLIDGCQEYGSHWQDESIPQVYEYTWPLSCNNAFPAIGHLSLYSVAALKYFAINNIHPPTCFSRLLTWLLKNIETKKKTKFLSLWIFVNTLTNEWSVSIELAEGRGHLVNVWSKSILTRHREYLGTLLSSCLEWARSHSLYTAANVRNCAWLQNMRNTPGDLRINEYEAETWHSGLLFNMTYYQVYHVERRKLAYLLAAAIYAGFSCIWQDVFFCRVGCKAKPET